MSWNYRVLKSNDGDDHWFKISEVYYNEHGAVRYWSKNGASPAGNTIDEIREDLQRMLECLDKEILDEDKLNEGKG